METTIVSSNSTSKRAEIRNMPESDWIDTHASGTLRKNKRLKFAVRKQYLHERANFEFGNGFEIIARSRITFGDAYSEADCKPITEAGWFFDRYITLNGAIFPDEWYELKSLNIEQEDGSRIEGIGIVIRKTIAKWIPQGHIVACIITEFCHKTNQYLPAINPL